MNGVCERINSKAIDNFLTYQYVPHPETIWEGVYKLPPGHFLIFENGKISIHQYWDLNLKHEAKISEHDAQDAVSEILSDSVRLRLQSDVPLGSFLSGGIDSSLVTALARALIGTHKNVQHRLPVSDFDETKYAAQVANHLVTVFEDSKYNPMELRF